MKPNRGFKGILMSTSFIGYVSIVEVCVYVCGLNFMLEELKNKSRQKVPQCGGGGAMEKSRCLAKILTFSTLIPSEGVH